MIIEWLIIILILSIIEVATVNLTTVWFIASGIVTLFLSFIIKDVLWQFSIFVILGVILLITTRDYLIKKLKITKIATNLDRIIGGEGIVTEEVYKNQPGEVYADGKRWTAISDEFIPVNTIVDIISINGVKIKIRKKEE